MDKPLTLAIFREMTKNLPPETIIRYNGWYKGNCLSAFDCSNVYVDEKYESIVMNPGEDYNGE